MVAFSFLEAVKSPCLYLMRLLIAAEEAMDSGSSVEGHDFNY